MCNLDNNGTNVIRLWIVVLLIVVIQGCTQASSIVDGYVFDLGTYQLPSIDDIPIDFDVPYPPTVCVEYRNHNKQYSFIDISAIDKCGIYNMYEYNTLTENQPEYLTNALNKAAQDGWKPYGNVVTRISTSGHQTLVIIVRRKIKRNK